MGDPFTANISQPTGLSPATRPVSFDFSIENSAIDNTSETARFSVDNGQVAVTALASWTPSCSSEPGSYLVSLMKWGFVRDTIIPPSWGFTVGTRGTFKWSNLDSGSYFLRVQARLNLCDADATLSGTLNVR
jgi:hypothetical protein